MFFSIIPESEEVDLDDLDANIEIKMIVNDNHGYSKRLKRENELSKKGFEISDTFIGMKLNSYNIYPGQVLYVQDPTVKDTSKTSVTPTVAANNTKTETKSQVSPTTKIVYHTVQKGDTLWGIANQYKGVSVEEIKKWNNLSAKSQLYVGQKLKIAIAS